MKKLKISDFWIYKFRYQIGIGILSLGYLAIIIYTLFITPNGLTAGEIENTKSAVNLDFSNIFQKYYRLTVSSPTKNQYRYFWLK